MYDELEAHRRKFLFVRVCVCVGGGGGKVGGGRAKIVRKTLLPKICQQLTYILPFVYTYFIICLKNKKKYHYDFENSQSHFHISL